MLNILLELLNMLILIPSAFLCYIPMRNQLRYSPKKIVLHCSIIFTVCLIPFTLFNTLYQFDDNILLFPLLTAFFFYYKSTIKADLSQALAVFVFFCSFLSFFTHFSYMFDAYLYPENTYLQYGWEANVFRLFITLIFTVIFIYPLKKYASSLIDNLPLPRVWYLTLPVSLLFLTINLAFIPHYYNILYVGRVFNMYLMCQITLFLLYIFLSVTFYFIAVGILEKSQLIQRQRFLEMQESQYIELKKHIDEIRKLHHDMRQSIRTIHTLAEKGKTEAIEDYLTNYESELPLFNYRKYCENNAVDALLNYYSQKEYDSEINMNWQIDLPNDISISETDLCSIIGNLIENAIYGCQSVSVEDRKHSLSVVVKNETRLYIVSTNTFDGNVKQSEGQYLSTKRNGCGIGIASIRITAEKYNGVAKFHHTGNKFYADIMLKTE